MKRELKSAVVLLIAALACGCASERGGMLRYEDSPHHYASIYATNAGNCNGIGCCPSQASCSDRGQVLASAAAEFRFNLEVRGKVMPEDFRLSANLSSEKTISKPVCTADPVSESSKIGANGGVTTGLDVAGLLLNSIMPLTAVTRVLSVGNAIVAGINNDDSVSRAKQSERKAAYSQLTDLVIAGAEKEFELQKLSSPWQENAESFGSMPRNVIEYTVWIKPLRIRVKEEPENAMDKDAKLVNHVEVETDVEARTKADQRMAWKTQFHGTFGSSSDLQSAVAEAMDQAGKAIATLTYRGLSAIQSRGTPTSRIVSSSSGAILTSSGPVLSSSDPVVSKKIVSSSSSAILTSSGPVLSSSDPVVSKKIVSSSSGAILTSSGPVLSN